MAQAPTPSFLLHPRQLRARRFSRREKRVGPLAPRPHGCAATVTPVRGSDTSGTKLYAWVTLPPETVNARASALPPGPGPVTTWATPEPSRFPAATNTPP